jgi:hypothetical protein
MRSVVVRGLLIVSAFCAGCGGTTAPSVGRSQSEVSAFGTIEVGGRKIDRLEAAPVEPADPSAVAAFMGAFTADPITDFRTAAAAAGAASHALKTPGGVPLRLGDVAYVRPGLGNIMPSPVDIFVLGLQFRNVVLLYTNMTDTTEPTALRRVTRVGGVDVPASLAGQLRLWAIGSEKLNLISFAQQSDVTLEQLNTLDQHRADLGFNPLRASGWVFAHSQGVADTVLSDFRLRRAGFSPYGPIVAFGSAVKGGRLLGTPIGDFFLSAAEQVAGAQGRNAMLELTPSVTAATFLSATGFPSEDVLDAYLGARITAAFGGVVDPTAPQGNVRSSFLGLAATPDYLGQVTPNDGVENTSSTLLGAFHQAVPQTDHILIIEDPQILHDALVSFIHLPPPF